MAQILGQLQQWGAIERVRHEEGKVEGTRFRYLFESYDSNQAPRMINWNSVKHLPVRKDPDLRERVRGDVETYVYELFQ
jgi:hypothetical protein